MLLNALERLVMLSLSYPVTENISDEESTLNEKSQPSENVGLFGLVSNVFGTDNTQSTSEQLSVCSVHTICADFFIYFLIGRKSRSIFTILHKMKKMRAWRGMGCLHLCEKQ